MLPRALFRAVAPGEIVTLRGINIGPDTPVSCLG